MSGSITASWQLYMTSVYCLLFGLNKVVYHNLLGSRQLQFAISDLTNTRLQLFCYMFKVFTKTINQCFVFHQGKSFLELYVNS